MKIKSIVFYLALFLMPINTFAVYDILSINITPTDNDIQFCFKSDYYAHDIKSHTYLAAQINNEFYFLSQDKEMSQWLPGNEPPFFSERAAYTKNCFEPFPKSVMQDISVYAGVGISLEEVQANNRYAKIFNGFAELPQPEKNWTIMVYMVGSNLESPSEHYASQDIIEMLKGSPSVTDTVNMVVTTGDSRRYGWNTVKRLFIHDGQQNVLEDIGKQSMINPQTLSDFVQYALTNFPAQHYALILWGHGGGTVGYGHLEPMMTLTELHEAYQTIRQHKGKPLDIVLYDACVMSSIEVAEVTALVANAMGASIENEPGHGFDYEYLLNNIAENPPPDGIAFGKIVKSGYLKQSVVRKSFRTQSITYSILDLTQLTNLHDTFSQFTTELELLFKDSEFFTYEMLSQGIIRAPGYPSKGKGKILRSLDEGKNIPIDFYNILQTVSPEFEQLKSYAEALQADLKQLVVDYETNDIMKAIDPDAGRISLDIGKDKSYLSVLPEMYSNLDQTLNYYNQKRLNDTFEPSGQFFCPGGFICADAKWWTLQANEVMGIDGYYGQQTEQGVDVHFIKPLYRYQTLEESLEIGVNGQETACQYQLCVNETECSDITVTENQGIWLADVLYNDISAILTLCQDENAMDWVACSVVQYQDNVWGRDIQLFANDTITPTVLHLQDGKLTQKQSQSLVVGEGVPVINKVCDMQTAVITANYFGKNGKQQFERLCDKGDCVCEENASDDSCVATSNQFKAGVRIEVF